MNTLSHLNTLSHEDARSLAPRSSRFALALVCACALASAARTRAQGTGTSGSGASVSSLSPNASVSNAPRARGSITVRVVDDANQPVPNAMVFASPQGRQFTRNAQPSYDNTASRDGKYVLSNLDAGLYSVSISVPGYVLEPRPAPADPDSPNANSAPLYRPGDTATLRVVKGGVITGRVTDADGNPVVGARVNAMLVRTLDGRPAAGSGGGRDRRTDDRGVYRLYGLAPGVYVVYAGGKLQPYGLPRLTPYDADVPTYYPSSSRDGAVEVQVQAGQEMTDIDIRYRGDKGHAVSGTLAGLPASAQPSVAAYVTLSHAATGGPEAQAFVTSDSPTRTFSLEAVGDGEYDLTATTYGGNGDALSAAPVHVSVHGADVSGLRLTLAPMGSLAGRVALEPLKAADAARDECKSSRPFVPQETLVFARREDNGAQQQRQQRTPAFSQIAPDDKGEFLLPNLREGRYRLGVRLFDEGYYLRAVTLPAGAGANAASTSSANSTANNSSGPAANSSAATNARVPPASNTASDLARSTFALRAGDRVAGALVSISAGAALLRGRVTANEGEQLPEGLRVYLVPSERERAEDVLRYGESSIQPDGTFSFSNLAPGSYLLLARPAPATEQDRQQQARPPLAFDAAARAALRRDAEAAKTSVALQPCQRTDDFTLRLPRQ